MKHSKHNKWKSPYFKRLFITMSVVTFSILVLALLALQAEFFHAAKRYLNSTNQKYMADAATTIDYKKNISVRNVLKAYSSSYGPALTASNEPSAHSRVQALKAVDAMLTYDSNLHSVSFYNDSTGKISSFAHDLTYSTIDDFADKELARLFITQEKLKDPILREITSLNGEKTTVYTYLYWVSNGNNNYNAISIDLLPSELFRIFETNPESSFSHEAYRSNYLVYSSSDILLYQNLRDADLSAKDFNFMRSLATQAESEEPLQFHINRQRYQVDFFVEENGMTFVTITNLNNLSQLFHFRVIVFVAIIFFAIILGLLLNFTFSNALYRPIQKLKGQAAKLSSQEEWLVESGEDEMSYISESIHSATFKLTQLFEYKESTLSITQSALLKEQLISGKYSEKDFWEKCREHQIVYSEKFNFSIILCRWSHISPSTSCSRDSEIINYAVLNVAFELLEPLYNVKHIPLNEKEIIFFCFSEEDQSAHLISVLKGIQIMFQNHFDIAISFILSDKSPPVGNLPHTLSQLQELACYHYFYDKGCILSVEESDITSLRSDLGTLPNFEQLKASVLNGSWEEVQLQVAEYFSGLQQYNYESAAASVNLFASRLVNLFRTIEECSFVSLELDYRGLYLRIIQSERLLDAQAIVCDSLRSVQTVVAKETNQTIEQLADYIILSIQNSFADFNLSSKSIAQQHHISVTYLNRLVKQKTGYSVSAYIKQIRLEHAARLLKTTDSYVESIAEKTGFENTKYFYTVFKNEYGISPTNYRIAGSMAEGELSKYE